MPTKTFRELLIWQKAKSVALLVYELTRHLPVDERFGMTSQMRRAAVSISSNIAEGYQRFQPREKRQFLVIAYGSAAELESQLEIAKELFSLKSTSEIESLLNKVQRMLNSVLSRRF